MKELETLKQQVEKLWVAQQQAPTHEKKTWLEKYRLAYEAYRKQRIWLEEMSAASTQAAM